MWVGLGATDCQLRLSRRTGRALHMCPLLLALFASGGMALRPQFGSVFLSGPVVVARCEVGRVSASAGWLSPFPVPGLSGGMVSLLALLRAVLPPLSIDSWIRFSSSSWIRSTFDLLMCRRVDVVGVVDIVLAYRFAETCCWRGCSWCCSAMTLILTCFLCMLICRRQSMTLLLLVWRLYSASVRGGYLSLGG